MAGLKRRYGGGSKGVEIPRLCSCLNESYLFNRNVPCKVRVLFLTYVRMYKQYVSHLLGHLLFSPAP